jgi:hypothetical protein
MARCLAWNCASSTVVAEHDWVGVQPVNAIAVVIEHQAVLEVQRTF